MPSANLKTSLLVEGQVPEFVREQHPLFITFLEAYYEFLEQQQSTQNNDLTTKAKALRYVSDVDESIDEFEESFINNFASLIPQEAISDKAFLIKNVLPLYLARGNIKSYEFLFRLLYGEDVQLTFPKNNILRASAGNWVQENVLRVDTNIYTFYTGDGTTTTFLLAQEVDFEDVTVTIDDVEISSGFFVRKESKKIIFNTAPVSGVDIKVFYSDFNENLLSNRKLTGSSSGATALIERAVPRLIGIQTSIELSIDDASRLGTFLNAEVVTTDIIADDDETLIQIGTSTVSPLSSIRLIDGGSGYNVGDRVIVTGGLPETQAEAIVSSVFLDLPDSANVVLSGAGFQLGGIVLASNVVGTITLAIDDVDVTGANSANSYTIFTDIVAPYVNTVISSSDYGFPSNVILSGENVQTRIADALSRTIITGIGPIENVVVLFADISANNAIFDAEGAKFETLANTFFDIKNFGSVGKIRINNGGNGYEIGDEIVFGANPAGTSGIGAAAAVTNVNSIGAITQVEIQPYRVTGTANTQTSNVTIIGNGTFFDTELLVGDRIMVNSEVRFVNAIASATSLNVNVSFTRTSTERNIGAFDRFPVGGISYSQINLPNITVSSANSQAANANVEIVALMGNGEEITANTSTVAGEIRQIRITNPGAGYEFLPAVDLTQSGDGTAIAEAEIERSFVSLPGRWTTSEGILSALERRVQGLDYFIDFTYVTSVATEFSKYKEILKGLLHPAGFRNYAEYPILNEINTTITLDTAKNLDVSGRVNVVANSIYVIGTNTKFNVANTLQILTIGTEISVNNQIRTVNNIISEVNISVSSAFTTNSNLQPIVIIT
jgi:hypothetical protein